MVAQNGFDSEASPLTAASLTHVLLQTECIGVQTAGLIPWLAMHVQHQKNEIRCMGSIACQAKMRHSNAW